VRPGAIAAAVALSACGYGFSQHYVAQGGVDRIHVRPFENRSTEPELGATVTSALRAELARRGSDAGEGAPAVLTGEVRATEPVVTSTVRPTGATPTGPARETSVAATWRIGIEVRARLTARDGTPVERIVRRELDFLAGADPLETEGRRALALRRGVDEVARDLLRAFER
jgi:hypothetical protein